MAATIDPLLVVQFPHPGSEHRPRRADMDWNRGEHRRKFLKATGTSIDHGVERHGEFTFWGEWEPQSRIIETYRTGGPGEPRWLHDPWWAVPRHRQLLQNTDPLVFGDRFRYSNCRQTRNGALRRLPPGSIVLFGSAVHGGFVLDTVFVVARPGVNYRRGSSDHLNVPAWVRSVVFDPLAAKEDRAGEPLRLYEGARYVDDPAGPFSFVPCRPYAPGDGAFARPRLELDPRWVTPRLAMGAKATEASAGEAAAVWSHVVAQVQAAGLSLGVALDVPPGTPPPSRE